MPRFLIFILSYTILFLYDRHGSLMAVQDVWGDDGFLSMQVIIEEFCDNIVNQLSGEAMMPTRDKVHMYGRPCRFQGISQCTRMLR